MKNKIILAIGLIVLAVIAFWLIGSGPETNQPVPPPAAITAAKWQMISYNNRENKTTELSKYNFTLELAKNKLSGVICNSFSGSYRVADGIITATEVISTKRACLEIPGVIENDFFRALRRGAQIVFSEAELRIISQEGNVFLFKSVVL